MSYEGSPDYQDQVLVQKVRHTDMKLRELEIARAELARASSRVNQLEASSRELIHELPKNMRGEYFDRINMASGIGYVATVSIDRIPDNDITDLLSID